MSKSAAPGRAAKAIRPLTGVFLACVVLAAAGGLLYVLLAGPRQTAASDTGALVAEPRSYVGKVVPMQHIQPVIGNGQIRILLDEVIQAGIVGFSAQNDQGDPVPMMVYLQPSGHIKAGTAQCACGGDSFLLAGRAVVCDACRAAYDIDTLAYLSGAAICARYPLAPIDLHMADGVVAIAQKDVPGRRNQDQAETGATS